MNSSADSLKRASTRASILLVGSTGAGKSATINHLLNQMEAKTEESKPETRATLEFLVTVNDHDNEASNFELGIIDTPGLNDTGGMEQDACNLCSMKYFFENHALFSKCYPNLIFLLVSANENRIEGANSGLANTLRGLKELGVVDQSHPNVVAVLTFCCSVSYLNVTKWKETMEEKKKIISDIVHQVLAVRPPVVLLENDKDSNGLKKDGDSIFLPNSETQPENLYDVCQKVLEDNGDHYGLSTFNACLAKPGAKKQHEVCYHKVIARNVRSKEELSAVEKRYFNILMRGAKGVDKPDSRKKRLGSKENLINNSARKCGNRRIWSIVAGVAIVVCVILLFVTIVVVSTLA